MSDLPQIQSFVSDEPRPVTPQHPLWNKPLPQNRHFETISETPLTYAAYFSAISQYLGKIGLARLAEIASQIADRPILPGAISQLDIHLEKHGAFYHPAKLILHVNADRIACVVNVAVSQLGQETIVKEFHNLERLSSRYANNWLPQGFNCLALAIDGQQNVQMFMGEWFEDYHEFHLSLLENAENPAIRVWDPENANNYLSVDQAQQIFLQAARILTAHYRLDTTEQIASWHHAAGDFVVCVHAADISVKLVTVRGYEPLFKLSQADESLETILNTVLIFFLNICMKLRIDRMDGVDDMVWNHLDVVPSIITGFFEGLDFQAQHQRIPPEMVVAIKVFLATLSGKDVRDIYTDIANRIESKSPDLALIQQNLDTHIAAVIHGFRQHGMP